MSSSTVGAPLQITTLGDLRIVSQGAVLEGLASRKAEALLVYLACSGRSHAREALADLLWNDLSTERALGNLSVVLTSLRQRLGSYVQIDRRAVSFNLAQPHWLDVRLFEAAVDRALQQQLADSTLPAEAAAELTVALDLYQGDFLQGFLLRGSAGFEHWALAEQERLRRRLAEARRMLGITCLGLRDFASGLRHATSLLALDPLNDAANQLLLLLLAGNRQRGAALAHYERYRQALAAELNAAPELATTRLYEQIRDERIGGAGPNLPGEAAPAAGRQPLFRPIPQPATPLLGREAEMAQVAARLADPRYRLLTLVGPGGIGKTRLALEVAANLQQSTLYPRFSHGVVFVGLADLTDAGQLAATIAEALQLSTTLPDVAAQLLAYLHEKQLLLVLDNLEQLLDGVGLLGDILQRAPGVVILATSRERLGLKAEWLLEIGGIAYPPDDPAGWQVADPLFSRSLPGAEQLEAYAAVRLFLERVQRTQPDFKLDQATIPAVLQICQLVDGMPLALELVAAWTRTLSCLEIAGQLAQSLDLLTTTLRDVPARHRSMRAVFDHSWRLLSAGEQSLLRRLSVFRAGWALAEVAALSRSPATSSAEPLPHLPLLAGLIDKSLVRQVADGRFELHELVRQYADERLREVAAEHEATHEWHAYHYAAWLRQLSALLIGSQQRAALAEAGLEFGNLRAAWQWACRQAAAAVIDAAAGGLSLLCDARSRFQEGYDLFGQAVAALERVERIATEGTEPDLHQRALAQVLSCQALCCERLGRYAEGQQLAERSLALAICDHEAVLRAFGLGVLGRIADRTGDYLAAQRFLQESLALYQMAGDQYGLAGALHQLGSAAEGLQQYDEARQLGEASRVIRQQLGDQRGEAFCLNQLGIVAEMQQRNDDAARYYEQSLALFRVLDDRWAMMLPLSNLGDLHATLGNPQAAAGYYRQSLQIGLEIWAVPQLLTDLVKLATLLRRLGRPEEALALIALPLAYPATTHAFHTQAEQLYAAISALLEPDRLAVMSNQAGQQTLEATVTRVLSQDLL